MQVDKILFPITTLGPGNRFGIWTIGCLRNCKGCANPELQFFDTSKEIEVSKIIELVKTIHCDGATISGGEPFLQVSELKKLVEGLNDIGIEDILIYTGFTLDELIEKNEEDIQYILNHIAVLIDGPFIEELVDDVPLRGSSNQKVWLFNEKYGLEYQKCLNEKKKIDIIHFDNETHFIGIPFKNYQDLYLKYLKKEK